MSELGDIAFSNSAEVTAIGALSLQTLRTQGEPNGNVTSTTVLGSYNLPNLNQGQTVAHQNVVLGNSVLMDVGPLREFSGNLIAGYASQNSQLKGLTNCILLGMGSVTYDTLFTGRDAAKFSTVISTSQNTFATANDQGGVGAETSNILLVGNSMALNVGSNCLVVGAGGEVEMTNVPGMLFTQGSQPFNNKGFSGCCTLLGAEPAEPSSNDQLVISHSSVRLQNLKPTEHTSAQCLVMFDPTTGQLRPADPLGAVRRLFSAVLTSDLKGEVRLDLSHLGVEEAPHVVATVFRASKTTFHAVQTIQLTNRVWVGIVFRSSTAATLGSPSMFPAGAGNQVHVHVSF